MDGTAVDDRIPQKLTGERPIEGRTPDGLLALHAAGYREVRDRIGAGRFLDLGCGLGDGTATFASPGRTLVGLDYDAATAAEAARRHAGVSLRTVCGDGGALPFRSGSFDHVCSSHLIEHFVEPWHHVREIARVLAPDGSALFLTPNAPADFENPYHVYLFEPDELHDLLSEFFGSVAVVGLDGSPRVRADFEARRAMARRFLSLDPWGLRHRLPRSWFVGLHAAARRVAYPLIARNAPEAAPPIGAEEFSVTERIEPSTLVLLAVAEKPRR